MFSELVLYPLHFWLIHQELILLLSFSWRVELLCSSKLHLSTSFPCLMSLYFCAYKIYIDMTICKIGDSESQKTSFTFFKSYKNLWSITSISVFQRWAHRAGSRTGQPHPGAAGRELGQGESHRQLATVCAKERAHGG